MPEAGVRIAMWSGPRNISTAMMRAWEARGDCAVIDEPLYAHYLKVTGIDHPGRDQVLEHHDADVDRVIARLIGPIPDGKALFYQKHMTHHLIDGVPLDWVGAVKNCFLIREPREMLTSLAKVIESPTLDQTGLPQQVALFDRVCDLTGESPPVIDGRAVLEDPAGSLAMLCEALDIPFTERMLSWPAGRRDTDGVWAEYWYKSVEQSTGFGPYTPKNDVVPDELSDVLAKCESLYEKMAAHQLKGVG